MSLGIKPPGQQKSQLQHPPSTSPPVTDTREDKRGGRDVSSRLAIFESVSHASAVCSPLLLREPRQVQEKKDTRVLHMSELKIIIISPSKPTGRFHWDSEQESRSPWWRSQEAKEPLSAARYPKTVFHRQCGRSPALILPSSFESGREK